MTITLCPKCREALGEGVTIEEHYNTCQVVQEEVRIRRAPEANVEVFALGHYEQMQIDLALQAILEYNATEQFNHNIDENTLASLVHIFGSHGTITITRTNQG